MIFPTSQVNNSQGCCLLSSFNETIVGFLTQAERDQGIEEFDTIFQKTTQPPINVWPEGAFASTEMERGFHCRFNGPLAEQRERNLHEVTSEFGSIELFARPSTVKTARSLRL